MPKYMVTVQTSYVKELTIFAASEDEAEAKAEERVSTWNCDDFEITDVEEA